MLNKQDTERAVFEGTVDRLRKQSWSRIDAETEAEDRQERRREEERVQQAKDRALELCRRIASADPRGTRLYEGEVAGEWEDEAREIVGALPQQ